MVCVNALFVFFTHTFYQVSLKVSYAILVGVDLFTNQVHVALQM